MPGTNMRRTGWVRLWVVLTIVGVPVAAEWQFQQSSAVWQSIDDAIIKNCVEAEFSQQDHPESTKCERDAGGYKTFFQREEITPAAYWSRALGTVFAIDLTITALLLAAFYALRWVWRGFHPHLPS